MKRLYKTLFVIVLFALLGLQSAFGEIRDGKDCKEFAVASNGIQCENSILFPWFAMGGGWVTKVKGVNIGSVTKASLELGWLIHPVVPKTDGWFNHLAPMCIDNRTKRYPDGVVGFLRECGESGGLVFQSGDSAEVTFLGPPVGCDPHGQNCTDYTNVDTSVEVDGTASIGWIGDTAEDLRGVPLPTVQYYHPLGLSSTEFPVPPAPVWRDVLSLTADGKHGYSFALANPGTVDVTVKGTLTDQNSKMVSTQTWIIPAGGARGVVLLSPRDAPTPGFGNDPFNGGPTFTGMFELKSVSPSGALTVATSLQFTWSDSTVAMSASGLQGYPQ